MNPRLATGGLVVFLLADIALVTLAIRSPGGLSPQTPTPTAASVTSPLATQANASQTSTAASTTSPSTAPPAPVPVPVRQMIVALDAKNAWRAQSGSCRGGGALVQTTRDGGKTWSAGTSPAQAITRVQPLAEGTGFVVAAGKDCTLAEYTTADRATTWQKSGSVRGGWAREIKDSKLVVTPLDSAARPCGDQAVLDLFRASATQAQSLCHNGNVKGTTNGGATWSDAGRAPGGRALSARDEGGALATYAARVAASCSGVEIVRVIGGGELASIACVETSAVPAPGEIGISTVARAGWLVVGDETWVAGADLKAWKRA